MYICSIMYIHNINVMLKRSLKQKPIEASSFMACSSSIIFMLFLFCKKCLCEKSCMCLKHSAGNILFPKMIWCIAHNIPPVWYSSERSLKQLLYNIYIASKQFNLLSTCTGVNKPHDEVLKLRSFVLLVAYDRLQMKTGVVLFAAHTNPQELKQSKLEYKFSISFFVSSH